MEMKRERREKKADIGTRGSSDADSDFSGVSADATKRDMTRDQARDASHT